jgi:biotin carboxyl carrier protein
MGYLASSGGREHRLEVRAGAGEIRVRLDDREIVADLLRVHAGLYSLLIGGRSYEIDVLEIPEALVVLVNGQPFRVEIQDEGARRLQAAVGRGAGQGGRRTVTAPIPGRIARILVRPGDTVQAGAGLVVLEAMKMENELRAPAAGTVRETRVAAGQTVAAGDVLVVLE